MFVNGGNISSTIIGGSADNGGGGLSSSSYNTVIVENASVGSHVSGGLAQITQGGAVASHNSVLLGQGASRDRVTFTAGIRRGVPERQIIISCRFTAAPLFPAISMEERRKPDGLRQP